MNTQLATTDQTIVTQKGDNIEVQAQTPDEMKQANRALIAWCEQKMTTIRIDYIELDAAYKSALEKKWKSSVLKRHAEMAKKRIEFYRKIKTALEHGFYIVPNFPVTAFAIRTDRKSPMKLASTSKWNRAEQKGLSPIPQGEGGYQNPFPEIWQRDITPELPDSDPKKKHEYYGQDWRELDFPINMAKPQIMEAADRAMALKLFDDLGVLPSPNRKVDPIIVGRIKDPRSPGYGERKMVSFIIAWALDTSTL